MINIHSKPMFPLALALLATISSAYIMFLSDGISKAATAQPLTTPSGGMNISGNQTMGSPVVSGLAPYNNPNLGFSLEYPSDWQKEESLSFTSPQGGMGDRAPEAINVVTEVLPSSDFSLDSYTDAAMGQVESFENFQLLDSSSTTLRGLPAHTIVYTFTDEQTPLQNLQAWTVKDGMAYVITYGGVPEEFNSSLPALQSVSDSFSLQ
jgi:PsbP-like protein